jgi:predicted transposase YdaD
MTLVNYIRENQSAGMPVKKAVDEAVKRCIKEDILRDFLKKHRAEVMNVCMTEYNEEVFVNGMLEAGRQEGLKAGRQEGLQAGRAESAERLERLNRLNAILIEQKRYDDLERSTKDTQFQNQLLAELVPETKQKESVPVFS